MLATLSPTPPIRPRMIPVPPIDTRNNGSNGRIISELISVRKLTILSKSKFPAKILLLCLLFVANFLCKLRNSTQNNENFELLEYKILQNHKKMETESKTKFFILAHVLQ